MKITITEGDYLPIGDYELTDENKLWNAKANLASSGANPRDLLLEYDRIAGRLVKNGLVLPPQSLWEIRQQQMNRPIENLSEYELESIVRRAENSSFDGSRYQQAKNELDLRERRHRINTSHTNTENQSGIQIINSQIFGNKKGGINITTAETQGPRYKINWQKWGVILAAVTLVAMILIAMAEK